MKSLKETLVKEIQKIDTDTLNNLNFKQMVNIKEKDVEKISLNIKKCD